MSDTHCPSTVLPFTRLTADWRCWHVRLRFDSLTCSSSDLSIFFLDLFWNCWCNRKNHKLKCVSCHSGLSRLEVRRRGDEERSFSGFSQTCTFGECVNSFYNKMEVNVIVNDWAAQTLVRLKTVMEMNWMHQILCHCTERLLFSGVTT